MVESNPFLYPGSAQRYDELLERDGSIRAHWRPLIEHLSRGGADTVRRCVDMTRRLIIENGVTTTSTPIRRGAIAPGNSIRCRC